jgi:N-acyl-D-aspartate/D-glutamate deacylase
MVQYSRMEIFGRHKSMMDAKNSRRTFLKGAAVLGCSALIGPDHLLHGQNLAVGETRQFDLVIEGGTVIDGSGKAPFAADVGIVGSKIAAIGKLNDAKATLRINAQGLAVAPGFIDIHAHTNLRRNPKAQSKIFQGVTLDITGPDGGSPFPRRLKRGDTTEAPQSISEFSTPIAMNLGSFVGFGTVRELVLGNSSRKPTIKELELMKDLVRQAMEQGALGLSSGVPRRSSKLPGPLRNMAESIRHICAVKTKACWLPWMKRFAFRGNQGWGWW